MPIVTADSYGIDATGATDVTTALAAAINAQPSGNTFQFHAGGLYLANTTNIWTPTNVIIDGQGAFLFRNVRRSGNVTSPRSDLISFNAPSSTLRNLNIYGFRKDVYLGSSLTTVAGSPTISGSTMLLDAANEEVRLPQVGLDYHLTGTVGFHNYETPYYFRGVDGLCRFEASLSSTSGSGPAVISIYDDDTDALLTSTSVDPLTSAGTYTLTFDPGTTYLGTRFRVTIKKVTSTGTLTVHSITPYGEAGYRFWPGTMPQGGGNEFQFAIVPGAQANMTIEDCWIEGPDGDGIYGGAATTNLHVDGITVRCCGRQGIDVEDGNNGLYENCTIREAGRSGMDFEPNTAIHSNTGNVVRNMTFRNIRNYTFAMINWARNNNVTIEDITSYSSGAGFMYGGARGLTLSRITHVETYRDAADLAGEDVPSAYDWVIAGTNVVGDDLTTEAGFFLDNYTNTYNPGTGNQTFTPDNIDLTDVFASNPTVSPYYLIEATNSSVTLAETPGGFQTGEDSFFVDQSGVEYTPSVQLRVSVPGPSSAAFQTDAFQQDTFDSEAGGIDASPTVFTPDSVALGANNVFVGLIDQSPALFTPTVAGNQIVPALLDAIPVVYEPSLTGGIQYIYLDNVGTWDSPDEVWDSPTSLWDGSSGVINQSAVLFTPSTTLPVTPELIDQTPVLYAPQINAVAVFTPLINAVGFLFTPMPNMAVAQELIDATPEVFEFSFPVNPEPDLIDASAELYTPNVNPIEVDTDLINAEGFLFTPVVAESVAVGLIDQSPEMFAPAIGAITPELLDATPVVYTPSLERLFIDLIDASPEVFEPQKVNIPVPQTVRLDDTAEQFIDASPLILAPYSIELAPPQTVFVGLLDATALLLVPHISIPTRPIIILHARYDPVTHLHARYDPVILKHAQNSRQG